MLTAECVGSDVVPVSSVCCTKMGPNSASSSSTSSSFSAPSHSDAGPKWVCSSIVLVKKSQVKVIDVMLLAFCVHSTT